MFRESVLGESSRKVGSCLIIAVGLALVSLFYSKATYVHTTNLTVN